MTRKTTHSDKVSEIHISEGEALRDFARVLDLVPRGWHVVIDSESANLPVAVISPPATVVREGEVEISLGPWRRKLSRKLSEVIALLAENSPALMDADFARDVEEAIASHREPLKSAWE